ncbi:MAG: hypothetical protein IBX46_05600 [Desulfuromonadales bacterium]|nr:hypothetical protein [Desulfuromonadales bacterium]
MRQDSTQKNHLSSLCVGLAVVLGLGTFIPPVFAGESALILPERSDFSPSLFDDVDASPDFLAPVSGSEAATDGTRREETIIPFIGSNPALTLLPTPERPTISASDILNLERPEVTAGIHVDLGRVKFNLGYTLPAEQVDEFVRPLGVELEPGREGKGFSLGVKIPF